jgi:hypothetical protein
LESKKEWMKVELKYLLQKRMWSRFGLGKKRMDWKCYLMVKIVAELECF